MTDIEIYTKALCPYCWAAKALLKSKDLPYREVNITFSAQRARQMRQRSQRHTVPQIFIAGRAVGGYDDLASLDAAGDLERLLAADTRVQIDPCP